MLEKQLISNQTSIKKNIDSIKNQAKHEYRTQIREQMLGGCSKTTWTR